MQENEEITNDSIEDLVESTTLSLDANIQTTEANALTLTASQTVPETVTSSSIDQLTTQKEPEDFNGYGYKPPSPPIVPWTPDYWNHHYSLPLTPPHTIPLKPGGYEHSQNGLVNTIYLTTDSDYNYKIPETFHPSHHDFLKDQMDSSFFVPSF